MTPPEDEEFHTTRWSIVLTAKENDDSAAGEALAELCQTYWKPLYAFLRRSGQLQHDAQDLTQAFFTKLIDKQYLDSVTQAKGRFRSFLLVALKHFVANQRDHERAAKRGGKFRQLPFDYADAESWLAANKTSRSPDQDFEYNWAITVLDHAIARVRDRYHAAGKSSEFELLKPFLVAHDAQPSYQELGEELGISESSARSAAHRIRKRYRQAIREQVAMTVDQQQDIDDEMNALLEILKQS